MNLGITRLVICRNFSLDDIEGSCGKGDSCKFVHADLSQCKNRPIHVNYSWKSIAAITYPCLPAGDSLSVLAPNERQPAEDVPSERILLTRGATGKKGRMSRCAHYYFNRMCNRGAQCNFIHVAHIDPTAGEWQKAPAPTTVTPLLRPSNDGVSGPAMAHPQGKMPQQMHQQHVHPMMNIASFSQNDSQGIILVSNGQGGFAPMQAQQQMFQMYPPMMMQPMPHMMNQPQMQFVHMPTQQLMNQQPQMMLQQPQMMHQQPQMMQMMVQQPQQQQQVMYVTTNPFAADYTIPAASNAPSMSSFVLNSNTQQHQASPVVNAMANSINDWSFGGQVSNPENSWSQQSWNQRPQQK